MKHTLTLVPTGGLGQRLSAMASAVELAGGGLCDVKIAWPRTRYCRQRFSDIFLPPRPAAGIRFCEAGFCDLPSGRHNLWLPTVARTGRFRFQTSFFRPQDTARLTHALAKGDAYAASGYQLTKYSPLLIPTLFHPHPFILEAVDKLVSIFTPLTVGVTIRRIDVRPEMQQISISAFTKILDEMVENGQADTFFLSSDDARVRRTIVRRYGPRIIMREGRNMFDAAVDLWAMSRTCLILGSYRSAFAQVASELNGTPLRIVGAE